MADLGGSSWWEWFGGIAFVAVTGLFAFTHKRIGEVKTEMKVDQGAEFHGLSREIARMEATMNERFMESSVDRKEIWKAIQANLAEQVKQHAQNLDRLSQIPTREEMMRMLQQFMSQRPPHSRQ